MTVYGRPLDATATYTDQQKEDVYDLCQEQGLDRMQFTLEFGTICSGGRSNRNYDELDKAIDFLQERGVNDYLVKTAYGATGGNWDCTDANTLANFSSDDRSALVTAAVDTLQHMEGLGVDIDRTIVGLWNEWTRTQYGASSTGVGSATQKALFNAMVTGLRAAYPTIKLGTPIFSIVDQDTITWTDITTANIQTGGVLESYMSSCDYLLGNFYPGILSEVPIKGVGQIRRVTRLFYDSFVSAMDACDVGGVLAAKPIIWVETGLTYVATGQRYDNTSGGGSGATLFGYYHGGANYHADCVVSGQLNQLRRCERTAHIGRYQITNRSNTLDDIDNTDNYGDTLWNSGTPQPTALHVRMAQHNGVSETGVAAIVTGGLTEPS